MDSGALRELAKEREARRASKRHRAAVSSPTTAGPAEAASAEAASAAFAPGDESMSNLKLKRRHVDDRNSGAIPGVTTPAPAPPGIAADVWAALDLESKAEVALKIFDELGMPAPPAFAAAASAGPGDGNGSGGCQRWECKACTFINVKPYAAVCEICGTPVSGDASANGDHGDDAAAAAAADTAITRVHAEGDEMVGKDSERHGLPQLDVDANVDTEAVAAAPRPSQALTVLTWNVWFKELRQGHRMAGLGDEIARVDPDVIAMQEVTPSAIVALRIQPWIKRYRSIVQARPGPYFCVVLIRRSIAVIRELHLDFSHHDASMRSNMGRGLVGAVIRSPWRGCDIAIGTTHLESPIGGSADRGGSPDLWSKKRRTQIRRACKFLEAEAAGSGSGHCVLLGDLNWSDPTGTGDRRREWDGPISASIPGGWEDAWATLRPTEPGYTYDAKENGMLLGNLRKRLDRCLYLTTAVADGGGSGAGGLAASEVSRVGMVQIGALTFQKERTRKDKKGGPSVSYETALPLLPSDHFGLLTKLELTPGTRESPDPGVLKG